jgi:two-component system, NtrC family, response regulator AtoC
MAHKALILVVDDEQPIRNLVREFLHRAGHDTIEAAGAEEALEILDEKLPDLIVCDMKMPKMDGLALIEEARKRDASLSIIMLTGYGTIETAVEAMRRGAVDFVEKPVSMDRLTGAVQKALNNQALRREVLQLRSEQCKRIGDMGTTMIGSSPKMTNVFRTIKQVAKSPTTTVLIQGDSGTGKELIAKSIHLCSDRRDKRFMDINCAALTETLLESELFGYEKGSFTGAVNQGKIGLFEAANGGTVFLDEIGEMSLPLQAKLLRVLQEKRFKRVGGIDDVEVDIRIVASTNRDLEKRVNDGDFRLDLYYRLRVIPIYVPALCERSEDIMPIADHYIDMFSNAMSKRVTGLTPEARASLESHTWPGNVRELKNVIERAVILCPTDKIGLESLLFGGTPSNSKAKVEFDMHDLSIVEMERQLIHKVLENTAWKRAEAARILGINRTTLYNKIRDYELVQEGRK